ncbi:MAG: SsrA-binding protein SmpB [bacterium]
MAKNKKDTKLMFRNKRAYFDYEVYDKYEAGIMLQGTEVKSIRNGNASLIGSFCYFNEGELFVKDMDISTYEEGSYNNHEPKRDRKLLMHKGELNKLIEKTSERGFAIIPLKMYPNDKNIFKVEIALVKGRKKVDKREYIKEREIKREMKDAMKI